MTSYWGSEYSKKLNLDTTIEFPMQKSAKMLNFNFLFHFLEELLAFVIFGSMGER